MTAQQDRLRSTAQVTTDRSDRWIKQLATGLRFDAEAPDEQVLQRVQQVVGGHPERFAAAEGLAVHWQRLAEVTTP